MTLSVNAKIGVWMKYGEVPERLIGTVSKIVEGFPLRGFESPPLRHQTTWRDVRVVEGARLECVWGSKASRGFESPSLRIIFLAR
jgi:hypothetical protein